MRAVEQIIRYLHEQGSLTPDQLSHLERLGLWHRSKEDNESFNDYFEVLHPEDWELEVERTTERVRRKGKRGRSGDRPAAVTAEELNDYLTEQFDEWRSSLEGLLHLGRRLGACRNWQEATVVVRNSPTNAVTVAVEVSLRSRSPSLKVLWQSLALETYRDLPEDWRSSANAIGAYRTALKIHDYSEMNRDQWILKQPAVSAVFNLRQAQLLLLRTCERVYRSHPEVLASGFHRDYHPLAYWTFVILYNIRRPRQEDDGLPIPLSAAEHVAMRKRPDDKGWMRAEAHAAWMDPISYVRDLEREQSRTAEEPRYYICPRHWDHLT